MKKILGILVSLLLIVTMFSVSASIKIYDENNSSTCRKLIDDNQQKNIIGSSTDNIWDRTYGGSSGDEARYAIQTTDGGYIICGSTSSYPVNGSWSDGWIVKTDSYGNELWNKAYGGSDSDYFNCVQQTSDGGYILVGGTLSYGELWLLKTDVSGAMEWYKTFGSDGKFDWNYGSYVQQTSDGGYILVGLTEKYNDPEDIWLIKTDSQGNMIWDKAFDTGTAEYGFCVQKTSDDGYILVGDIFTFAPYGHIAGWAIKTDIDGNITWDKKFSYPDGDCKTKFIYLTSDGGYIIAGGTTCFGNTGVDAWLIKIDGNGNEEWNRTYGEKYFDEAICVQQTSDGGYIFTGDASCDLRLVKTNATGILEWDRRFGGSENDWGRSVQQVSDGGYIVGGCTKSYGAGHWDFWLIKTDENGQLNESNNRPNKPMTPAGLSDGIVGIPLTFSSNTIDIDGDMIYYCFDWDDGTTSGWIGPYLSGKTGNASHKWTIANRYEIQVKAKDEHGRESEWSEPFTVGIAKNKNKAFNLNYNLLEWVFDRYPNAFPILQKIIQRLGLQ